MTKATIHTHSPHTNTPHTSTPCKSKTRGGDENNSASTPLHNLRNVRCREEVSKETIASRLGIDVDTVEQIENESSDLTLSILYEWKELLNVPIVDLLVDTDNTFEAPQKLHAQLEALMRTAIMLSRQNRQPPVAHMAHNLINQLLEIMPELRKVVLKYGRNKQRRLEEYGLDVEQHFLDEMTMNCGD